MLNPVYQSPVLSTCTLSFLGITGLTHDGRSSRSPEGKKEVKGLHSTFAKAEAETVQPEKAEHLILPAQGVDTALPGQPSDRYCVPNKKCMTWQGTCDSHACPCRHRMPVLSVEMQANKS